MSQPLPPLWALVESAILAGGTRPIVEHRVAEQCAAASEPPPSPADIDRAYVKIVDRWISDAAADDEQVHAYHVRLRQHLYQRAYQLNDFKTCLAIAGDLAKLQSQYNRQRAVRRHNEASAATRQQKLALITGGKT